MRNVKVSIQLLYLFFKAGGTENQNQNQYQGKI